MGSLLPCRYFVACMSLLFFVTGLVGIVSSQGNCAKPACVGKTCDPNMGCGLCSPCQCRSSSTGSQKFECHACSMEMCPCSNLLGSQAQPCCDGLACLDINGNPAASGGFCKKMTWNMNSKTSRLFGLWFFAVTATLLLTLTAEVSCRIGSESCKENIDCEKYKHWESLDPGVVAGPWDCSECFDYPVYLTSKNDYNTEY